MPGGEIHATAIDTIRRGFHLRSVPDWVNVLAIGRGVRQRLTYTTIGDTTNTAARLEAMTKTTPCMLLMSDVTRAALSTPPADLVYVEEVAVRGRTQAVKLWSVTASAGGKPAGRSIQSR